MRDERKTKKQLIEELVRLRAERDAARPDPAPTPKGLDDPALRALVALSPEPLCAVDLEGRIALGNDLAAELMGYADAAELQRAGLCAADFVAPEEQAASVQTLQELGQTREARTFERTLVRKDGTRFPGEISARSLWSEDGTPYGILAAIRDIGSVRKTEQLYRTLVETSPDAIALVTIEGRLVTANRRCAEVFGYDSVADLLGDGRHVLELNDPSSHAAIQARIEEPATTGEASQGEYIAMRKDGTRFPIEVYTSVVTDEDGEPFAIIASARDLTARRQTEQRLSDIEGKFRSVVAAANDAMFLADAETGTILEANEAAAELLGIPLEEIVGMHQSELHPPGEAERYAEIFQDHIRARRAMISGLVAQHRDGRRIPIEISASVLEVGGQPAVLGLFRDTTERHEAEAELAERASALAQANIELERLHRAKDEFIATVSHELRTPLVTGMGYIELLLEGLLGPVSDPMTEKMGVALKNLRRLSRLIDNILDFQRLARREFTEAPRFTTFDPSGLLRETAAEFVVRSGRPAGTVSTEIPETLPAIRADRDMLGRVVANLLDNAHRHAGADARITLRAETEVRGVRIAVIDDGVGMDAAFRDRAFEPFARADTMAGGTGLGLAIVREILRSHDAPVQLDSEPGGGTTVRFTVPPAASSTPGEAPEQAPAPAPSSAADAWVLIVDDDTDMLDFVQLALTQRGYRVRLADSAERALAMLDRESADLILLDMTLPGMDGDELCRRLKSEDRTAGIPVLMFSARTERSARSSAEAAGCDAYLVKPVALADLLGAIERALIA